MAYTPTLLDQDNIASTSLTTVYTVPASTSTIIKEITLANTTSSVATFSVYRVPNGGSGGATNAILEDVQLAANSITVLSLSMVMDTVGDFIAVQQGTSSAICHTISGVEIT
jgi:hypothetical protein